MIHPSSRQLAHSTTRGSAVSACPAVLVTLSSSLSSGSVAVRTAFTPRRSRQAARHRPRHRRPQAEGPVAAEPKVRLSETPQLRTLKLHDNAENLRLM